MATYNQGFSVSVYVPAKDKERFEIFKKLLKKDPRFKEMNLKNPKKVVSAAFQKFYNSYIDKHAQLEAQQSSEENPQEIEE